MCYAQLIQVIAQQVAQGIAGTGLAIQAEYKRDAQKNLAKANAKLQRQQITAGLQEDYEANAHKSFDLSRQALAARGISQAANLGDRSVRAIGRAIGFEVGQDKAIIQRNSEIAARVAAAKLTGIDLTLASQKLQIGNTSGSLLAQDIVSAWLMPAGGMDATSFGGGGGGTVEGEATQLDASQTADYAIV